MTPEQTMLFKRLIEYAHRQAMMRNGQIAQDIRLALNDAARYWHLRDVSDPDTCRYYLASDDQASKFNDPAHVDRQIDADRAMRARELAVQYELPVRSAPRTEGDVLTPNFRAERRP